MMKNIKTLKGLKLKKKLYFQLLVWYSKRERVKTQKNTTETKQKRNSQHI